MAGRGHTFRRPDRRNACSRERQGVSIRSANAISVPMDHPRDLVADGCPVMRERHRRETVPVRRVGSAVDARRRARVPPSASATELFWRDRSASL